MNLLTIGFGGSLELDKLLMPDKRFRFTLHDFKQTMYLPIPQVSFKICFVPGEKEEGFDPFGFASK